MLFLLQVFSPSYSVVEYNIRLGGRQLLPFWNQKKRENRKRKNLLVILVYPVEKINLRQP